ncbi:MAG: hypothetical protein ACLUOI_16725 [Eisenbergiella sp.]
MLLLIMQVRVPAFDFAALLTGILYAVFETGLHIPLPADFRFLGRAKRCILLKDFR